MYLADIFTIACNLAGICGISLPCGFAEGEGTLPVGLQLIGQPFKEGRTPANRHAYEGSRLAKARHDLAAPNSGRLFRADQVAFAGQPTGPSFRIVSSIRL